MLRCILKNNPKHVIKKYFQIVLLVSKLFLKLLLCSFETMFTKGQKSLYVFFIHYIDSKFL